MFSVMLLMHFNVYNLKVGKVYKNVFPLMWMSESFSRIMFDKVTRMRHPVRVHIC